MSPMESRESKGGMVIELRPRLFDRTLTIQQTRNRLKRNQNDRATV